MCFVDNVSKISLGGSTWTAQRGCPQGSETPGERGPRSPTPADTSALSPLASQRRPRAGATHHAQEWLRGANPADAGTATSPRPTLRDQPSLPRPRGDHGRAALSIYGKADPRHRGQRRLQLQLEVEDEVTNERGRQRAVFNGQTWEWQRDGAEATRENRPGS